MQQLQHARLQRAAWQRNKTAQRNINTRRCSVPVNSNRQRISSCAASAAGDAAGSGGGDVVRPSAKAAAPPTPGVDVTAGPSSSGGSSSTAGGGSSTPGTGSSGSARSYSELYKTLYGASFPGAAGTSSGSSGSSSSSSGKPSSASRGNGSSSSAGVAGGPQQQHSGAAQSSADDGCSSGPSASNGHGAGAGMSAAAAGASAASPSSAAAPAASVEEAIRKAQQALAAAESSLSSIHKLRSAQPRNSWAGLLQLAKTVATAVAAGALLVASHAFGLGWQWAGATLAALGLAAHAYQRSKVTVAGAAAVAAACLATLGCSMRFGLVMLVFAYSSAKLRMLKEAQLPIDLQAAGSPQAATQARDWPEVACIAAVPTVVAIAYGAMAGCLDLPLGALPAVEPLRARLLTCLQGAVLGWYACCCGDAWSTELGSLSGDQPRLLTTLQPVRRGTHGGVTLLGLSGAAAGGLLVGLVFYCAAVLSPTLWVFETQRHAAMAQWRLIPLGLMAGLAGSLLDSLIGALLQFTGYDSTTERLTSTPGPNVQRISGLQQTWIGNNFVNVLSAGFTAALTAVAALCMFA